MNLDNVQTFLNPEGNSQFKIYIYNLIDEDLKIIKNILFGESNIVNSIKNNIDYNYNIFNYKDKNLRIKDNNLFFYLPINDFNSKYIYTFFDKIPKKLYIEYSKKLYK